MTRLAALAVPIFFLATTIAAAQHVLVEEAGPAIEISIAADPRVTEVPVLLDAISRDADELAAEYRGLAQEDHAERGSQPTWTAHYLEAFYEVTFLGGGLASVVVTHESYGGGAHGNQGFAAINLDVSDGSALDAGSLFGGFEANSAPFEAIRAYARDRLAFERADRLGIPDMPPEDMDWILDGTESPGNLSIFTLSSEAGAAPASGITLYFPPYQVGSYAEGSYVVEVPALVFADYLTGQFAPLFATGP